MNKDNGRPTRPRQKAYAGEFTPDASLLQERIERLMPRLRLAVAKLRALLDAQPAEAWR